MDNKCIYFRNFDECACNNDPDDYGECLYENGVKIPNAQIECKYYKSTKEQTINKKETRFFQRKAFIINFDCFTEVMQELLDDSSLEIEKDYPVLSMYSEGFDCCYDEDEIMERIGLHLGVNIIACFMYVDLEVIYFVCDK